MGNPQHPTFILPIFSLFYLNPQPKIKESKMVVQVEPLKIPFKKRLKVPADKSLTHRAFMLASIASGVSEVANPLLSEDCLSTKACLEACGAVFERTSNGFFIKGGKLREPDDVLNAGNSGTTARLLTGLLAGWGFNFFITGDDSLRRRPMDRVLKPLSMMGMRYIARGEGRFLPVAVEGSELKAIEYESPIASAQVKSAILLAGLKAEGTTTVVEPSKSRDHTERMLLSLGCPLRINGLKVSLDGGFKIPPFRFKVPGDPSSAAYWIALAALLEGAEVVIEEVLLNPTRIGFLEALRKMGADVSWMVEQERMNEPVGTACARYSPHLKGIEVNTKDIPFMIDEIPLLALVASQAEGETIIRGAAELRVKESDRIKSTVEELKRIGVDIEELKDGMVIRGKSAIVGGRCHSHKDHRIAMMLAIAGAISKKGVEIQEAQWVSISYPDFFKVLME